MSLPRTMDEVVDAVPIDYSIAAIENLFGNAERATAYGDYEEALASQVVLSLILLRKLRDEGHIDLTVFDVERE